MVQRPFSFNNGAIFPRADFGGAVKLEITNIGEAHWASLTPITALSFDFVVKVEVVDNLLLWKVVIFIVHLPGKQ